MKYLLTAIVAFVIGYSVCPTVQKVRTVPPDNMFTTDEVTDIKTGIEDYYQEQIDMLNETLKKKPICPAVPTCDCQPDYKRGHQDGMDRANSLNREYQ